MFPKVCVLQFSSLCIYGTMCDHVIPTYGPTSAYNFLDCAARKACSFLCPSIYSVAMTSYIGMGQLLQELQVSLAQFRQCEATGWKQFEPVSQKTKRSVAEDVKQWLDCVDHGACLSCYMENVLPFLEHDHALRAVCKDCVCDIANSAMDDAISNVVANIAPEQ